MQNLSKAKSKVTESSGEDPHPIRAGAASFSGSKCRVLFCQGYGPGSDLGKPLFSSRICIVAVSGLCTGNVSHARVSLSDTGVMADIESSFSQLLPFAGYI